MIDCGLDVLSDLRETNCDLSKIRYIIFTYMHYNPAAAAEILKDAKFSWLIFNHVFDKWHIRVFDSWKTDNGEKNLLDYFKSLPYPVSISHDGDEFLL